MNIFIAFANQDRDIRDKLLRQMNLVAGKHGWNIWSAKEIKAGERWDEEIERRLQESNVVILLLSTDFFNSDYIIDKELPEVIEKHKKGDCQIIPVIAHLCHWKETPFGEYAQLGKIQALPVGEKPIVSRGYWDNEAQPYFDTVEGIKDSILSFQAKKRKQKAFEEAQEARARSQREREEDQQHVHREQEDTLTAEAQRTQEAQRVKSAEAQRAKEVEAKRELETQWAKQAAWQKATDSNNIKAYQTFLSQYPQGPRALEAHERIQELKRQKAAPLPWGRYALIGGGLIIVLLAVWLSKIWLGGGNAWNSEGATSSRTLTTPNPVQKDSTAPIEPTRQDPPIPNKTPEITQSQFKDPFEGQMVYVAGGSFQMGSPVNEVGRSDDECQHLVSVGAFYMGKFEVTQAQWKAVMGNNPSEHKSCDDCPVENVSWSEVQTFIKTLNKNTGNNYRLPTEAEWEFAAKGGKKSKGFVYAGSNSLASVAWFGDNADSKTHSVGGKLPNELGLYDLSGNVWEWCQDSRKPYPCDIKTTADSQDRVIRGGSGYGNAKGCRTVYRNYGGDSRSNFVGFRLCSNSLH